MRLSHPEFSRSAKAIGGYSNTPIRGHTDVEPLERSENFIIKKEFLTYKKISIQPQNISEPYNSGGTACKVQISPSASLIGANNYILLPHVSTLQAFYDYLLL